MLLFSMFYWLPVVLLLVICVAVVGKVRAGRYKKEWIGFGPEAPPPTSAVAQVMTPIAGALIWAFAEGHIGPAAIAILAVGAAVLAYFVYDAAAKRRSESADR